MVVVCGFPSFFLLYLVHVCSAIQGLQLNNK